MAALTPPVHAEPQFLGALVIAGDRLDTSGGTLVNDGRLGFFSDLYYDARRDEWWALSDRGPGGGTLADASVAALGGVSPEKWEGLAIGPRLGDGSHLVLAGTDNDDSVTQNGSPMQLDVYFKPLGGGLSRIQCTIGSRANCHAVDPDGSVGALLPQGFDFSGYALIPGVLHAYKASAQDLARHAPPHGRD